MSAGTDVVLPTTRLITEPDRDGRWSYVQVVTPGNAAFEALPLRERIELVRDTGPTAIRPEVTAELAPLLRETGFPFR